MKLRKAFIPLALAWSLVGTVSCKKKSNNNNNGSSQTIEYTVTFESNGGSSCTSVKVKSGNTITLPTTSKTGYTFDGWYTDEALTNIFDATTAISGNLKLYAKWTEEGSSSSNPNPKNGSEEGALDAGSGEVVTNGSLNITSCSGEFESAYVEFTPYQNYTDYNAYISAKGANSYKKLEDKRDFYSQALSTTKTRIDFSGIKPGDYDIKIAASKDGNDMGDASVFSISVSAYDRSGYAHFNRTIGSVAEKGVGAYNDDGTLKDNAIILYVTDANKNTIELSYNGKTVAGIGNILNSVGKACGEAGHETQCKKVDDGKINYAAGNTNQGILADLAADDIPLVVRFVGIVSESGKYTQTSYDATDEGLIDGLTAYANKSSTKNIDGTLAKDNNGLADYGGTAGDNGHMARMKSGKHVTIEGIGNDACLDGWGIHFMCESAMPEAGKSFEIRNLLFMNNPEDATGMEGIQESGVIKASVERCWIHNNTFLKPTISNPAESDKADGDGSCDFKRGQYYTLAYNYFEYCHKTNIIGSSDSSLQFNITMHHNLWYNCGSRIPLLRQANLHFYNNYISCDANDKSAELSYVTSLRANSYMYSENNYYDGCKQVCSDTGGTAKLYGNEMVQCFGKEQTGTIVSSREATVAGNCAYNGTTLQNFDTNSSLFYYNSSTKQSECYLTTAVVARQEVIKFAGSNYRTKLNKTTLKTTNTPYTEQTPTEGVTTGKSVLPTSKNNGTIEGIIWTGIQGYDSKTGVKARGKFATFKVTKAVTMNITMTASSSEAYHDGFVVKENGTIVLIGSGSVVLMPGIYTIVSCQKDKDTYVTALSFDEYDSEALKEQLIAEYNAAYSNIPANIEYNDNSYNLIKNAMDAYEALGDYKSEVSTNPSDAFNTYISLGQDYVEGLINNIGTVTKDSYDAIAAARTAYDALIEKSSTATVSNYNTLVAAEASYEGFKVQATIDAIDAIGTVTLDSKTAIETAKSLYDSWTSEQKASVTNYNVLTAAIAVYTNLVEIDNVESLIDAATITTPKTIADAYAAYNALASEQKTSVTNYSKLSDLMPEYVMYLINQIGTVTASSGEKIVEAEEIYAALTSEQKTLVTNYDTLTSARTAYNEILSARQVLNFTTDAITGNSFFTVAKGTGSASLKSGVAEKTYDGVKYTKAVKVESATTITFTTSAATTITIITDSTSITVTIDGTAYTPNADGVITTTISAGAHTISRGNGEAHIYAVIVG